MKQTEIKLIALILFNVNLHCLIQYVSLNLYFYILTYVFILIFKIDSLKSTKYINILYMYNKSTTKVLKHLKLLLFN